MCLGLQSVGLKTIRAFTLLVSVSLSSDNDFFYSLGLPALEGAKLRPVPEFILK